MGGGTKAAVSEKEEEEAQVDIWKYVFGFTEMAEVKCAIELGIAERGIFKEKSTGQDVSGYAQTPLSRLLMKHGLNSMAAFVLFESSPVMLAPWHRLSARVLAAGTSAFEAAHGDDVCHCAASNPAHSKLLDEAMACDARVAVPAIIDCSPQVFEGLGLLVDVGGGDGTSLGMVVKACPWIRGINFDLPHVVSLAPYCAGVEHVGGNMFESIPKADAAYLMESIPQDTGKVIIAHAVLGESKGDKLKDVALLLDMVMMAHTNKGKERTLDEWAHVLHEAGFSRHTVKHIRAVQSVIEAYP
ncbi:hypothetical protein RJ639_022016 [Escallonia herrerae]|uniref:O-methyltransferase C-terminal domain-containing protein n=1 Tax=Escallonia herrerae TaxID=1293975 RepID=A0AA89AHF9_9ASTE|nr:hypothetical protein RJ639_022016 [Escallonia herrerae]